MTNMRRGFTMIELVFVIVIIGILAAVAIPKLSVNKENAFAKVCENELSGLITEMTGYYANNGYFSNIEHMTNLELGVGGNVGEHGVKEAAGIVPKVGTPITYICDGKPIAKIDPKTGTYTDDQKKVHTTFGLDVTAGAAGTVPSDIAVADMTAKATYKEWVIGGN